MTPHARKFVPASGGRKPPGEILAPVCSPLPRPAPPDFALRSSPRPQISPHLRLAVALSARPADPSGTPPPPLAPPSDISVLLAWPARPCLTSISQLPLLAVQPLT